MWANGRQNRKKNSNFWFKYAPKGYIPLSDFLTKFGMRKDSQDRTLVPILTIVTFEMWAYSHKIAETGIFLV